MKDADRPRKRRRAPAGAGPERLPWLRYDRISRAVTEHLRVRPLPGQPFWVLAVRNPVHHTHYQVFLPEYPAGEARFCSCVDFSRRGIGTCKHVEAATAWLDAHPEVARPRTTRLGATHLWGAIDRARRRPEDPPRPEAVRWREGGRVLFERPVRAPRGAQEKRGAGKGSGEPEAPSGA